MRHQEKIDWMVRWAHKNKVLLVLEGECGFGRECVGISANNIYPDYEWEDSYENGFVWKPRNAYHKYPCVAVLGRGEEVESQLYDWLKWFDDNNFVVKFGYNDPPKGGFSTMDILLGKHLYVRMVKEK